MKDSVHKQACLPKQTSESSYSVASQQNMDAISEICWQLNSVLTYLLFTEVPSKRFFKEKYCLECRLRFFFLTRVWIDQRLNPWGLLSGSVANRTNRTKNQSNSIGRIVGNRTYSNWTFSVSSINRTRDFDHRTLSNQSNSIDPLVRIFFGRKTKRIQVQLNRKDLSGMYLKQFENKNISINPEWTKIVLLKWFKIDKFTIMQYWETWTVQ